VPEVKTDKVQRQGAENGAKIYCPIVLLGYPIRLPCLIEASEISSPIGREPHRVRWTITTLGKKLNLKIKYFQFRRVHFVNVVRGVNGHP
jgi:hypothetical protein